MMKKILVLFCWIIPLIIMIYIGFSNPHMTQTQKFFEYWDLILIALALAIAPMYFVK